MVVNVSNISTVGEARNYLENVRRAGRMDLYAEGFRRLCELEGQQHDDPMTLDFWRAIAAAEEVLRHQRGRTVRLSRTRQKIKRVGAHRTVEDLALAKKASDGFFILAEAGLGDLTAEYIVLRYSTQFSADAVASAEIRLAENNIDLPPDNNRAIDPA